MGNDPAWFDPIINEIESGSVIKLDIGSGGPMYQRTDMTWKTVDLFCPADIEADMADLPFDDGVVDAIWSSHALEHIDMMQVHPTLSEWFRVLKPGGTLTLLVPDMDYVAKKWLEIGSAALQLIFGNQRHPGEYHKMGWNLESLKDDIERVGFEITKAVSIFTPDYNQDSLRVEAKKPDDYQQVSTESTKKIPDVVFQERRELLIGCGSARDKRVYLGDHSEWNQLTTLDINSDHNPDIVHDLMQIPYPFEDAYFDEIHAYEVLEHLGKQGDYESFFAQFSEFWRILKPGGMLCATVPWWQGRWAWADPGHTRVITPDTLTFLNQDAYQDKNAMMTDYRFTYTSNFEVVKLERSVTESTEEDQRLYGSPEHFVFILRAIK